MKLTKLLILFLFLSLKGFSQQAVLTSSGEKVVLNFLSSLGGTVSGTLTVIGNTTISGTTNIGSGNIITGNASSAIGTDNIVSGSNSIALGTTTSATAQYSTTMGWLTQASAERSTAMGYLTQASGIGSTAMGTQTIASGRRSTAMGSETTASGNNSTAIGENTSAYSFAETVIGIYNTSYTPTSTTSFSSGDRLFVIGNGQNSDSRSNALTILKDGTLTVNGNTNISGTTTLTGVNNTGTITNTGSLINNGNLTVNGNVTITGTITAGAVTYPNAHGAPNQVLSTTGSGTLAWTTPASGGTTHTIGESYGGGIVFYITDGGLHGLIVETQNQSTFSNFYDAQNVISNPDNHSNNGRKFTDWRLPTLYELDNLLYAKYLEGELSGLGFAVGSFGYWSSTESGYANAWYLEFEDGSYYATTKYDTKYIRAIRSF